VERVAQNSCILHIYLKTADTDCLYFETL